MIEKITDMLAFASPLRIIERQESLVIQDYRPTWVMAIFGLGFLAMTGLFVFAAINLEDVGNDPFVLWVLGILGVGCLIFALRGSIREVYYFDMRTDSYRFVRRFIYRKEVIEGSLDQFTGAYVKTVQQDEGESYHVVLRQEGMFLTGVSEQTLREETPILNSFSNEARIAKAISSIVSVARHERSKKKG